MRFPTVSLEAAQARLRRDPLGFLGAPLDYVGLVVSPVCGCPDHVTEVRVCAPEEAEAWGLYARVQGPEDDGPHSVWLEDFGTLAEAWAMLRTVSTWVHSFMKDAERDARLRA